MPYSHAFFKQDVKVFFDKTVSRDVKILDVGPGMGTYSLLLNPLGFKLDCLEIFEPYISKYNLNEKYQKVIVGDICNFDFSEYDFIILGDVLEHLTVEDSTKILNKIISENKGCLVAVPYLCEQGTMEENEHETHLQPELTPQLVIQQYPQLDLLVKNQYYGYYINRRGDGKTYWDLDKQEFVIMESEKIRLETITRDEVLFTNVSDTSMNVNVIVSSDFGVHYETTMELYSNFSYFVSVEGHYQNKKISLSGEGINKYYWMY